MMKRCRSCNETKDIDDFGVEKKGKDKHKKDCKECVREQKREYYQKNKEKIKKSVRRWEKRNKRKVRKYKSEYKKRERQKRKEAGCNLEEEYRLLKEKYSKKKDE